MSQIPYATYNPTANPIQSSVVPFVPAPVPQEVQIGTGIENLGPAFAAFSQTLASFVANQVTTNRQKALQEGEDKLLKSRKRFKDLVASGEISPQENPWEALGAAAADGTLAAQQFRVKAQSAYNEKLMKDPSFAMSVTGGEDFINEMLANELSNGMQNPVWQRSFMKESSSFAAEIGAVHGDNVAKFRRAKMTEALTVGISADMDSFQKGIKNLDRSGKEFETLSKKALSSVQSRIDEAFQTVGGESLKSAYQTLVDLEIATGSDPAVMDVINKIKAGTGKAVDTEQYRASRMEREEQIQKAKDQRDVDLSSEFFIKELRAGKTPEFDSFAEEVRSKIRPDISDSDLAQLHSTLIQKTDSMRKQLYENFKSELIFKTQTDIMEAYGVKGGKFRPEVFYSSVAVQNRNPRILEAKIARELQSAAAWTMRPMNEVDAANTAKFIMERAQVSAEYAFTAETANMNPQDQARLRVMYSSASGIPSSATPEINIALATYGSTQQYTPTIDAGLLMYREAKRQNVDPKSVGLSPQAIDFYKTLDPMVGPGTDVQTAALAASRSASLLSISPGDIDPKLRDTVVDKLDSYFWWDGKSNETRYDSVLDYFLPKLASNPAWRFKTLEQQSADLASAIESGSVLTNSGWVALPDRSEGLTDSKYWNALQTDIARVTKKQAAMFVLDMSGQYQLLLQDPNTGVFRLASDEHVEMMKEKMKDYWPTVDSQMNPSELSSAFKDYERRRAAKQSEMRRKFVEQSDRKPKL